MRTYIEAREIVPDEREPEFDIRLDMTEQMDKWESVIADIMIIVEGTEYSLQVHHCGHEDSGACDWQVLE